MIGVVVILGVIAAALVVLGVMVRDDGEGVFFLFIAAILALASFGMGYNYLHPDPVLSEAQPRIEPIVVVTPLDRASKLCFPLQAVSAVQYTARGGRGLLAYRCAGKPGALIPTR